MKITNLLITQLAALSLIAAGVGFVIVGLFHPPNVSAEVGTATWINVHLVAITMCFFGVFGVIGLYAKQLEKSGWLGLISVVLLCGWFMLVIGFSFIEAFILPRLKTGWLGFVESFLGMFSGKASTIDLGLMPLLWNISGPMFILGLLFLSIATYRAQVLIKHAALLLGVAAILIPAGAFLPPKYESLVLVLPGVALAWLGWSVWSLETKPKLNKNAKKA